MTDNIFIPDPTLSVVCSTDGKVLATPDGCLLPPGDAALRTQRGQAHIYTGQHGGIRRGMHRPHEGVRDDGAWTVVPEVSLRSTSG
jgi:hypothetical protein